MWLPGVGIGFMDLSSLVSFLAIPSLPTFCSLLIELRADGFLII
jgi:hypothetical protein